MRQNHVSYCNGALVMGPSTIDDASMLESNFGIICSNSGPNRVEMLLPEAVEDQSPTADCGSTKPIFYGCSGWRKFSSAIAGKVKTSREPYRRTYKNSATPSGSIRN